MKWWMRVGRFPAAQLKEIFDFVKKMEIRFAVS